MRPHSVLGIFLATLAVGGIWLGLAISGYEGEHSRRADLAIPLIGGSTLMLIASIAGIRSCRHGSGWLLGAVAAAFVTTTLFAARA